MTQLRVDREPHREMRERLARRDAANPFHTPFYLAARERLGWEPCLISLGEPGAWEPVCAAFLKTGLVTRHLELPSAPAPPAGGERFWQDLFAWARRTRVTAFEAGSFASPAAELPHRPPATVRRRRWEYVLDLTSSRPWAGLSSNHARNVKRGRKSGLVIRRRADADACRVHLALMAASMERREARGERVPGMGAGQLEEVTALVETGAGEVFQAAAGEEVFSSILLLRAQAGAYYHSAGTSQAGMARGASHFLVYGIAELLRQDGLGTFNLGGVSDAGSGLEQFKRGFGGRRIELEAAEWAVSRGVTRWLGRGVRLLRGMAGAGVGR
ncbi:GNAT family N-acetyltransferase [Candidatus Nitrospira bockiana]